MDAANNLPILIVGGFGASWQAYEPLRHILEHITQRRVYVTRLVTLDWLSIIVSDDYSPLLKKLHIAVNETLRRTRTHQLMLIAHSAGGILARIYMGDQPYGSERLVFDGFQRVATLVTLGTPHTTTNTGGLVVSTKFALPKSVTLVPIGGLSAMLPLFLRGYGGQKMANVLNVGRGRATQC